ncbi:MAG: OmpA family protein, partial [Candidatus Binatia bacterium]
MKRPKVIVLMFLVCLSLAPGSGFAAPDEYDESQSNPLRVVAYLVHPFGVITEWLFFRPFHYLVSANEQNEELFGHRPHPPLLEPQPLYNFGMSKRIPMETQSQPKQVSALPTGERVRVVTVEKVITQEVIKEVPQVVEVERVIFEGVAFHFDSAQLTDLGKGQVYLAAQRFKDKADVTIVVAGHTDNVGTD